MLGSPPDPLGDMAQTFEFIREIKQVNPATEIVLYTYTPVPMDGTLYRKRRGWVSRFPTTLDEWASDEWRQLMMRRGDGIPWMDGSGAAPGPQLRARAERVLPDRHRPPPDARAPGAAAGGQRAGGTRCGSTRRRTSCGRCSG